MGLRLLPSPPLIIFVLTLRVMSRMDVSCHIGIRHVTHECVMMSVLRDSTVSVHFTVCCSVLQSNKVCCSVLQCVAVCCSGLQSVALHPPSPHAPSHRQTHTQVKTLFMDFINLCLCVCMLHIYTYEYTHIRTHTHKITRTRTYTRISLACARSCACSVSFFWTHSFCLTHIKKSVPYMYKYKKSVP